MPSVNHRYAQYKNVFNMSLHVVPVGIVGYLLSTDIMAKFINRLYLSILRYFSNVLRYIKCITALKSLNFELDKFDAFYAKISAVTQIRSYN